MVEGGQRREHRRGALPVGGAEYEMDAEEGGSYEAGLQGSVEMVTMPWAGQETGWQAYQEIKRYIQGSSSYKVTRWGREGGREGGVRVVPGG